MMIKLEDAKEWKEKLEVMKAHIDRLLDLSDEEFVQTQIIVAVGSTQPDDPTTFTLHKTINCCLQAATFAADQLLINSGH